MKSFHFGEIAIDAQDFAVRSAAVLGIRDSGKTYTATLIAERLFDAGVPFIAFDPIGVWRFMRVPGAGQGYPVVVAGGQDGDLPLTVASAPEIVRAAMKGGVSVIIDLFSMDLSKADWRKIVMSCVKVLLHENQPHGLRHVFIEEAAEFIPQKINDGLVYAEVEKLARMGGNSRLGLTIINQRAEEVNKAVLELCDNLFLHRQKGRNSLTALSKWLDVANVKNPREIIESLSTLPTGECWAWLHSSERPVRVKVPEKNSLHPDRRATQGEAYLPRKAVDVAAFVETINAALEKATDAGATKPGKATHSVNQAASAEEIAAAVERGYELGRREAAPIWFARGWEAAIDEVKANAAASMTAGAIQHRLKNWEFTGDLPTAIGEAPLSEFLNNTVDTAPPPAASAHHPAREPRQSARSLTRTTHPSEASAAGVTPARQRILNAIAWLDSIGHATPDKMLVAFLAEASPKSSAFANNLGGLRTSGLIDYPAAGCVALTDEGFAIAASPEQALTHAAMMAKIGHHVTPAQMRLLEALCKVHPRALTKEALAEKVGASATSSAFANNLGRLRSLGLITYPVAGLARADDRLFPELNHVQAIQESRRK